MPLKTLNEPDDTASDIWDSDRIQVLHCSRCAFLTLKYTVLIDHLMTHDGPTNLVIYQCKYCQLIGSHPGILTEHCKLKHANSEPGVRLIATTTVNPESDSQSPQSSVPTDCLFCDHRSSNPKEMKCHLQNHHNLFNVTKQNFKTPTAKSYLASLRDKRRLRFNHIKFRDYPCNGLNKTTTANHSSVPTVPHKVNSTTSCKPPENDLPLQPTNKEPNFQVNEEMADGTVVVQPSDEPLNLEGHTGDWATLKSEMVKIKEEPNESNNSDQPFMNNVLGSRKRKMRVPSAHNSVSSYTPIKRYSNQNGGDCPRTASPAIKQPSTANYSQIHHSVNRKQFTNTPHAQSRSIVCGSSSSSGQSPNAPSMGTYQQRIASHQLLQRSKAAKSTMRRKRGRPPKLSVRIHSEGEVIDLLRPHVQPVGQPISPGAEASYESVVLAPGKPYATTVKERLLIEAYDTDGVQFLRNLLRGYYSPVQLAQYAWDANQRRGRPRSANELEHIIGPDGEIIPLKSLKDETFVKACLDLISKVFDQAFPDNLPVFINRMLTRLREQLAGLSGSALKSDGAPFDYSFSGDSNTSFQFGYHPHEEEEKGRMMGQNSQNNNHLKDEERDWDGRYQIDAEKALSSHVVQVSEENNEAIICANSEYEQRVPYLLLVQAYDAEPLRFLRNLIRSGIPHEELMRCTWKGMNTGRPRMSSAEQEATGVVNSELEPIVKRSLREDPRVQAYLHLVQEVCGRPLPENIGPHIHQILSSIRNKQSNNNSHSALLTNSSSSSTPFTNGNPSSKMAPLSGFATMDDAVIDLSVSAEPALVG